MIQAVSTITLTTGREIEVFGTPVQIAEWFEPGSATPSGLHVVDDTQGRTAVVNLDHVVSITERRPRDS